MTNKEANMRYSQEKLREAIMRLTMCARRECEICKYKDRPKSELPSDYCKERSTKSMNILADFCLRGVTKKMTNEEASGQTLDWSDFK